MPAPIVGVLAVKALSGVLIATAEHAAFKLIEEEIGIDGKNNVIRRYIIKIILGEIVIKGLSGIVKYGGGPVTAASYRITTAALEAVDTYDLVESFYDYVDNSGILSGEKIPRGLGARQPGEPYRKLDDVLYRYISSRLVLPRIHSYLRLKKFSYARQYATGISFLGVRQWALNNGQVNLNNKDIIDYTQDLYHYVNLPFIANADEIDQIQRIIINTVEQEVNESL